MKAPIPVKLDRERHVAWSNAALYRASLIALPPQRNFGHLVQMLWMCLVPDDATAFPTPEHVASHIDPANEERVKELWAVYEKLTARPKSKEAAEKNADGSTPSPSPSSS